MSDKIATAQLFEGRVAGCTFTRRMTRYTVYTMLPGNYDFEPLAKSSETFYGGFGSGRINGEEFDPLSIHYLPPRSQKTIYCSEALVVRCRHGWDWCDELLSQRLCATFDAIAKRCPEAPSFDYGFWRKMENEFIESLGQLVHLEKKYLRELGIGKKGVDVLNNFLLVGYNLHLE